MKSITLNETPYQNGLKYGKECAAEIRVSFDILWIISHAKGKMADINFRGSILRTWLD